MLKPAGEPRPGPETSEDSRPSGPPAGALSVRLDLYGALADAGKEILSAALKKTGGNISRAAGMLGIPRQILYYKLKKHPD